jgi:L-fuconolactonase
MLRIDAHHHLWDPSRANYAWMTGEFEPMRRVFEPAELAPDVAACGVAGTVVVQSANERADTDALLAYANATSWIAGVVAWVPLMDPPAAAAELDRLCEDEHVRGIRHLAHNEPDPDWLVQLPIVKSLALLGERDLVFEVPAVYPRHLHHVARLASITPHVRFVIDHLAKPPLVSQKAAFEHWTRLLASCAEQPNVFAKVSGLGTSGDGYPLPLAGAQTAVDRALELFGADRLMLGSDWPVSTLNLPYRDTVNGTIALLDALSPREMALVLGRTAAAVYRIPTASLEPAPETQPQLV